MQFINSHPISLGPILILTFHLRLYFSSGLFPSYGTCMPYTVKHVYSRVMLNGPYRKGLRKQIKLLSLRMWSSGRPLATGL
jgi:hypothetical protein